MNDNALTAPVRHRSAPLLILGLLVIASGATMLLDRLDILDSRAVLNQMWPLGIMAIGIALIVQHKSRALGIITIVSGALLFAREQRWIDFNVWTILPPILLLWGGGVIVWRALNSSYARHATEATSADFVSSHVVFSGTDLRPQSRTFKGAELSAVFGGIKLDLCDADIEGDAAVVDLYTVFGGIELHVPSDWAVKTDAVVVMAGLSDNRRPTSGLPRKTLVIKGFALFAGIDIRN
jgi:predicted membrane protein